MFFMSFVICKQCKYQVYCTFPTSGKISECDEYEDVDVAEPIDFNLQDFMELWAAYGSESASDVEG